MLQLLPHEALDWRDPAADRMEIARARDLVEGLPDRALEPDRERVVRVHLGDGPVDVHDLFVASGVPARWGVLHQVVAHRHHDIGRVEPEVRVVLDHESDRPERVRVIVREDALAQERRGDGNLEALAESEQRPHRVVTRHARAREDDGVGRLGQDVGRPMHLIHRWRRIVRNVHGERVALSRQFGHVLREDDERRARPLGLGLFERLPDQLRGAPGPRHLVTPFRHRSEEGHQVDHLM